MCLVHCMKIISSDLWQFSLSFVSRLTYSVIIFSYMNFWSLDSSPSSLFPVNLIGDGTTVSILLSRYRCMYDPYLNLCHIYYATSFINVGYLSMLDPTEQSNTNSFRYSYCPSKLICWEYVALPGLHIQAFLVIREGFIPAPLYTSTLARLIIVN